MKGVLLSHGPTDVRLVDLSHDLPAYDVLGAARFLRAAVPRFPRNTVHLAVIDPGVGSDRQALAVHVAGQWLVGPDNGLFSYLFDGAERIFNLDAGACAVTERALSATFHGRDLFAPAAAKLASGTDILNLAVPVARCVRLEALASELSAQQVVGQVWHVDHFGNLITSITADTVERFLAGRSARGLRVALKNQRLQGLRSHYAEVPAGRALVLIGSDGLLEVAVRMGHAAERFAVGLGEPVSVTWTNVP